MEHHFLTNDTVQSRKTLEGQLRECFGRVVYSHKTHEKCADILLERWSRIKLTQIILSAMSAAGFIASVFENGKAGAIAGVFISSTLLAVNAYTKNYDLGALAQKHKQTANGLWLIRERYLSLITDLVMGEKPIERLQSERDSLLAQLHEVYSGSPPTTGDAYAKAQQALKVKEDLTFAEEEIDAFLPKELKRSKTP